MIIFSAPSYATSACTLPNTFGTAPESFGPCWTTVGTVTASPGGPDINTSPGATQQTLETSIGSAGFQFSTFRPGLTFGNGSLIQDDITVGDNAYVSVPFSENGLSGALGFAVLEDAANNYSFFTLFDHVNQFQFASAALSNSIFSTPVLTPGSYTLSIGIITATSNCPVVLSFNATSSCAFFTSSGAGSSSTPAFDVPQVLVTPEPGTMLLFGLGAAALMFRRRSVWAR